MKKSPRWHKLGILLLILILAGTGYFLLPNKLERTCSKLSDNAGQTFTKDDLDTLFANYPTDTHPLNEETLYVVYDKGYQSFFWPPECHIRVNRGANEILEAYYYWD